MTWQEIGLVALAIFVAFILVIVIWNIIVRRRERPAFQKGEALKAVSDARLEKGELQASMIGEEIEERVKELLASEGSSLGQQLDFGTGKDGSLEIWFDGECYREIDEIPSEQVRDAVRRAVEDFNR